ncbi:MAG: hypothetical protein R3F59_32535 [Myxococcota bacterium]
MLRCGASSLRGSSGAARSTLMRLLVAAFVERPDVLVAGDALREAEA